MRPRPALLLAIHECHVQSILRGDKRVEFRRSPPQCELPADVLLYATKPPGAIIGRCRFTNLISGPRAEVWRAVGAHGCVTRDQFDAYFADRATAHALVIAHPEPAGPAELPFCAPQSFRYLRPDTQEHGRLLALLASGAAL